MLEDIIGSGDYDTMIGLIGFSQRSAGTQAVVAEGSRTVETGTTDGWFGQICWYCDPIRPEDAAKGWSALVASPQIE